MSFCGGISGGRLSAALAEDIANCKGHNRIQIVDRIHAAMIVLSFFAVPVIIAMLPYFFPLCEDIFKSFINWKDQSTFFTYVKIFVIIFVILAVIIFIINPVMNKLARLSIWYSLVFFLLSAGASISMIVLAMMKY